MDVNVDCGLALEQINKLLPHAPNKSDYAYLYMLSYIFLKISEPLIFLLGRSPIQLEQHQLLEVGGGATRSYLHSDESP